jgi:hypothetical protein
MLQSIYFQPLLWGAFLSWDPSLLENVLHGYIGEQSSFLEVILLHEMGTIYSKFNIKYRIIIFLVIIFLVPISKVQEYKIFNNFFTIIDVSYCD